MLRGFGIAFGTGVFLAIAFFFIAGTFYAVPGLGYFLIDGYVPAVILVNLAIVLNLPPGLPPRPEEICGRRHNRDDSGAGFGLHWLSLAIVCHRSGRALTALSKS